MKKVILATAVILPLSLAQAGSGSQVIKRGSSYIDNLTGSSRAALDDIGRLADKLVGTRRALKLNEENITVLGRRVGTSGEFVQQIRVGKDGSLTRVAFRVPETRVVAETTELIEPTSRGGPFLTEHATVKRIFRSAAGNERVALEQTFAARRMEDGRVFRVVEETEINAGGMKVSASIADASVAGYHPRRIYISAKSVAMADDGLPKIWKHAIFELPDDIPGEIVDMSINSIPDTLKFTTTNGVEYVVALAPNPRQTTSFDSFVFKRAGRTVLDDVNGLLADYAVSPGVATASRAARGMRRAID